MRIWIYENEEVQEIPEGCFGFVYLITNKITGRKYIGKKQFNSYRSKKVKDKKRRKRYILESDWKEYWGSCEELLEDIKELGEDNFSREILRLCKTKRDLTYSEVELQIKADVLTALDEKGNRLYYNSNIMSRWFSSNSSK
jgi:hypothetical protein